MPVDQSIRRYNKMQKFYLSIRLVHEMQALHCKGDIKVNLFN
jgi:hypothetical protein